MLIPEKIKIAVSSYKGEIYNKREIVRMVKSKYPKINEASIIPSDYCNNKKNKDPRSGVYKIFHYISYNRYKVL